MAAICPDCSAVIADNDEYAVGDMINCPDCGLDLEILGTDPLEVEEAFLDDDDEFFDDDADDELFEDEDDEDWDEEEDDE